MQNRFFFKFESRLNERKHFFNGDFILIFNYFSNLIRKKNGFTMSLNEFPCI